MNITINSNVFIAAINGEYCLEKQDLMDEVANALEFPDDFGENFDALHDYLTDLNWIDRKEIIFVINNYNQLMNDDTDENKETTRQIMKATIEYWKKASDKSFIIVEN